MLAQKIVIDRHKILARNYFYSISYLEPHFLQNRDYSLGIFSKNGVRKNRPYFARIYIYTSSSYIEKMRIVAYLVFLKFAVKMKPHPLHKSSYNNSKIILLKHDVTRIFAM